MRFLVDECTGPAVARWLAGEGHEVFSVFDAARGAEDDWILDKAHRENWIVISNDKDFGEMVRRSRRPHCGLILLRLKDQRSLQKIAVLKSLLINHGGAIADKFVVVTESLVRLER